jgi:hypothetical protein
MVLRVSNPVGFTVLEDENIVATGITVEVLDGTTGAELAILEDSFDREWVEEYNGTGSGRVSVLVNHHKLVADPDLLKSGNLIRLYLDGVPRFVFQIDHRRITVAKKGDDIVRVLTVSGRGALCLLEDVVVYPVGGIAGDLVRTFNTNAGDMLRTCLLEGQARGAALLVGTGFTASLDSKGAPWERAIDLEERAGQTDLLRLALKTSEVAADVWMTPSLVLEVANARGVDRSIQTADTGPVQLRIGEHIEQVEVDQDGIVKNVLVITSGGGLVERQDASSITEYRRREATLSVGDVTDPSQITRHAEAVFRRTGAPADRTVYRLTESKVVTDGRTPYRHFGLGDTILAPDGDGVLVGQVVYSITVSENRVGRPVYVVELASLVADFEEKLGRWLAALNRGALSGVAGRVAETAAQTATQTEATADAAADAAIAAHVGTYLHPDELADLVDVNVVGVSSFDFLQHQSGVWVPRTLVLNDASNVDTSGMVNGDVLQLVSGTFQAGPAIAPKPMRRELNSAQSVNSGTETNLDLTSVEFNEASSFVTWNGTTDQFDVDRDCLVSIAAGVQFAANAAGIRKLRILVNGVSLVSARAPGTSGDPAGLAVSVPGHIVSNGDTIAVVVYQDSGGALNANATGNTFINLVVLRDDG